MTPTLPTLPMKKQSDESALDFLRRFVASPGALEGWIDMAPIINGLPHDQIEEAEKIVGADPAKRDRTYPTTNAFRAAQHLWENATAERGRGERAAKAKELLGQAATTTDPRAVERQWSDLLDYFKTTEKQAAMLAHDLGVAVPSADQARNVLRQHIEPLLREAKSRQAVAEAVARVEKLYAKPKDYGLTKRELPKTPPPDAMVWRLDARQDMRRGSPTHGGFSGNKKGDVVQIQGRDHTVLAASAVQQVRDPEHGILARRQNVLVRPATEAEAVMAKIPAAKAFWASRATPYDDYNMSGYQTEAQRLEAEDWLRKYATDPVGAYHADPKTKKP